MKLLPIFPGERSHFSLNFWASLNPDAACVLLQSSLCCALHVQTISSYTSKSRMPSFVRRESELTSSFALTLQIQRIMARHYAGDGSVYPPSWPKSLLHAASHSSHMMSTPYLWSEGADGGWWEGEAIGGLPHAHLQRVIAASSQPPPAESMSPR